MNKIEVGQAIRHLKREQVIEAIRLLDADPTGGGFRFNQRRYDLIYEGKIYAQRPVVAYAIKLAHKLDEVPHEFGGTNDGRGIAKLTELGFELLPKENHRFGRTIASFKPNKLYNRLSDIHGVFGGQQQSGIYTPKDSQYIFLFTGESGEEFGYSDHWDDNGVFHYVGQGQSGDMEFKLGNKAIRDHASDGKELLVFQALGKRKPVKFVGSFQCANWEQAEGLDREGNKRGLIVFHLVPSESQLKEGIETETKTKPISLEELKSRAYAAATESPQGSSTRAQQTYYKRSKSVKDYVLARANGVCESCKEKAPFKKVDGSPYLEPHHTRRVADSGPDHPSCVGAICPNCHREIHSGSEGDLKNRRLIGYLNEIET